MTRGYHLRCTVVAALQLTCSSNLYFIQRLVDEAPSLGGNKDVLQHSGSKSLLGKLDSGVT
jgi:hypothetical protein